MMPRFEIFHDYKKSKKEKKIVSAMDARREENDGMSESHITKNNRLKIVPPQQ